MPRLQRFECRPAEFFGAVGFQPGEADTMHVGSSDGTRRQHLDTFNHIGVGAVLSSFEALKRARATGERERSRARTLGNP